MTGRLFGGLVVFEPMRNVTNIAFERALTQLICAEYERPERLPLSCSRQEKGPGQIPLTGLLI
jgi:hypothetical protein